MLRLLLTTHDADDAAVMPWLFTNEASRMATAGFDDGMLVDSRVELLITNLVDL